MKRILILLAIITTSCTAEKNACTCTGKYQLSNGDYYFVPKQPIDCETNQPTKVASSGYFVGCVD